MASILVVEDDRVLNNGLKLVLEKEGHTVIQNYGIDVLTNYPYDLAILDINLPGMDGFELSKKLKCPILFLTAKAEESNVLLGFSLGCEDYVTKPFSLSILVEKIKVILRRQGKTHCYFYKDLSYDPIKKDFRIGDRVIELSKKEHELLDYLIRHKEQILTKQQLLEAIWDVHGSFVNEGTVNVTINRLRKKMNANNPWIQTVFGIGYKWSETHDHH